MCAKALDGPGTALILERAGDPEHREIPRATSLIEDRRPIVERYPQHRLHAAAAALLLAACGTDGDLRSPPAEMDITAALETLSSEDLLRRIQVLASDELEGRAPGTLGEELTVEYLSEEFAAVGLQPGNPDGTYIQNVPLIGFTPEVNTASFTVAGEVVELDGPADYLAITRRVVPEIDIRDSDLVFVGYGVVAPEYGWDDYKGVDVAGKTIVMLVNDPPIPHPDNPEEFDPSMFNGSAMTYYGRWTYKYEIAAEKGAEAAIVVHETGPAGYPFAVLQAGWGRERFDVKSADNNMGRAAIEAWMPVETARTLFTAAGYDYDTLKQTALDPAFEPVDLGVTASFHLRNAIREVDSRNVVGMLEGSDPDEREEYIVYTAHWDHLGKDVSLPGDQIYNGALDNASGTAALVELAEAFVALDPGPSRSMLFLAVTAEEKGLLGSKYYAENPLYPLSRTVANINVDGVNQWGPTRDVVVIGLGNSTLDDVLQDAAAGVGRTVVPDAEPEKGFFYRSDQFELAKQGVPALYTDSGTEFIGKAEGWGREKRDEYTTNDYHKVSDEVKSDWDLSGAVEDLKLLFAVGYRVSEAEAWPEWKEGTEFKAKREAMLRAAGT
jgi:Zn-dependent M28 family amino/carboxypeptidase